MQEDRSLNQVELPRTSFDLDHNVGSSRYQDVDSFVTGVRSGGF